MNAWASGSRLSGHPSVCASGFCRLQANRCQQPQDRNKTKEQHNERNIKHYKEKHNELRSK